MNLGQRLRSQMLSIVFDPKVINAGRWLAEKRRQFSRQPHVVSVFLQLDDPYSYLLSYYLPELAAHYDIELRIYLSQALGGEYQPAPEMLAEYAVADCRLLASELGIPFLDKGSLPPTEHRVGLTNTVATTVDTAAFNDELLQALQIFWRGDSSAAANMSTATDGKGKVAKVVETSQSLLQKLGHYNSAMLHYAGEWYWGVDRLHYLTNRLDLLGASRSGTPNASLASIRQATKVSLPVKPPTAAKALPPIEYFHSFRSPYSYVALQQVFAIADAYGIEVRIRPVLPMVMRGMDVPDNKLMYIAKDCVREAARRKVAFGKFADPAGAGAERCLAVFQYAQSEHKDRDFLLNAGAAIWAQAIDVATDKGMRKVTGRTGLFWPDAKAAMESDGWREAIESNQESMMESGSWGVPSIRMGDFMLWGQDRDWLLVRHIEELCDTGDGILV